MSKYILITGGELFNKGAQSMTFITVSEIKKRYPDKKIILLSGMDYQRSQIEKEKYKFDILPLTTGIIAHLLGGIYKQLWKVNSFNKSKSSSSYLELLPKIGKIFNDTEAIIDISGYALSSQFGKGRNLGYLMRIKLAKKYGIKMYIMPQSFGPFQYEGLSKLPINFMLDKYLNYPIKIYAREQEGYKLLQEKFNLKNINKSYDMVLLNREIDLSNIYKVTTKIRQFDDINGVAIVPNMKNFAHGNKEEIMALYRSAITKIIDSGKKVYLIRHSFEDISACEQIKNEFLDNDLVIPLTDDMSCLEFDNLVKRFDFIIGSRYHSIIHAYKNHIPCISLGWATKYQELLSVFKQEKYIFDVRGNLDKSLIEKAVEEMLLNYRDESEIIGDILENIQNKNIFDEIML